MPREYGRIHREVMEAIQGVTSQLDLHAAELDKILATNWWAIDTEYIEDEALEDQDIVSEIAAEAKAKEGSGEEGGEMKKGRDAAETDKEKVGSLSFKVAKRRNSAMSRRDSSKFNREDLFKALGGNESVVSMRLEALETKLGMVREGIEHVAELILEKRASGITYAMESPRTAVNVAMDAARAAQPGSILPDWMKQKADGRGSVVHDVDTPRHERPETPATPAHEGKSEEHGFEAAEGESKGKDGEEKGAKEAKLAFPGGEGEGEGEDGEKILNIRKKAKVFEFPELKESAPHTAARATGKRPSFKAMKQAKRRCVGSMLLKLVTESFLSLVVRVSEARRSWQLEKIRRKADDEMSTLFTFLGSTLEPYNNVGPPPQGQSRRPRFGSDDSVMSGDSTPSRPGRRVSTLRPSSSVALLASRPVALSMAHLPPEDIEVINNARAVLIREAHIQNDICNRVHACNAELRDLELQAAACEEESVEEHVTENGSFGPAWDAPEDDLSTRSLRAQSFKKRSRSSRRFKYVVGDVALGNVKAIGMSGSFMRLSSQIARTLRTHLTERQRLLNFIKLSVGTRLDAQDKGVPFLSAHIGPPSVQASWVQRRLGHLWRILRRSGRAGLRQHFDRPAVLDRPVRPGDEHALADAGKMTASEKLALERSARDRERLETRLEVAKQQIKKMREASRPSEDAGTTKPKNATKKVEPKEKVLCLDGPSRDNTLFTVCVHVGGIVGTTAQLKALGKQDYYVEVALDLCQGLRFDKQARAWREDRNAANRQRKTMDQYAHADNGEEMREGDLARRSVAARVMRTTTQSKAALDVVWWDCTFRFPCSKDDLEAMQLMARAGFKDHLTVSVMDADDLTADDLLGTGALQLHSGKPGMEHFLLHCTGEKSLKGMAPRMQRIVENPKGVVVKNFTGKVERDFATASGMMASLRDDVQYAFKLVFGAWIVPSHVMSQALTVMKSLEKSIVAEKDPATASAERRASMDQIRRGSLSPGLHAQLLDLEASMDLSLEVYPTSDTERREAILRAGSHQVLLARIGRYPHGVKTAVTGLIEFYLQELKELVPQRHIRLMDKLEGEERKLRGILEPFAKGDEVEVLTRGRFWVRGTVVRVPNPNPRHVASVRLKDGIWCYFSADDTRLILKAREGKDKADALLLKAKEEGREIQKQLKTIEYEKRQLAKLTKKRKGLAGSLRQLMESSKSKSERQSVVMQHEDKLKKATDLREKLKQIQADAFADAAEATSLALGGMLKLRPCISLEGEDPPSDSPGWTVDLNNMLLLKNCYNCGQVPHTHCCCCGYADPGHIWSECPNARGPDEVRDAYQDARDKRIAAIARARRRGKGRRKKMRRKSGAAAAGDLDAKMRMEKLGPRASVHPSQRLFKRADSRRNVERHAPPVSALETQAGLPNVLAIQCRSSLSLEDKQKALRAVIERTVTDFNQQLMTSAQHRVFQQTLADVRQEACYLRDVRAEQVWQNDLESPSSFSVGLCNMLVQYADLQSLAQTQAVKIAELTREIDEWAAQQAALASFAKKQEDNARHGTSGGGSASSSSSADKKNKTKTTGAAAVTQVNVQRRTSVAARD